MDKNILSLLNRQINREFHSEMLYLALSAKAELAGFLNLAKWLEEHAAEEHDHAHRLIDYVLDRGQTPEYSEIPAAKVSAKTPVDILKAALEHEQFVTGSINEIMSAAAKSNDYATFTATQWFVVEQVEEEKKVGDLLRQFELAGDQAITVDLELDV